MIVTTEHNTPMREGAVLNVLPKWLSLYRNHTGSNTLATPLRRITKVLTVQRGVSTVALQKETIERGKIVIFGLYPLITSVLPRTWNIKLGRNIGNLISAIKYTVSVFNSTVLFI